MATLRWSSAEVANALALGTELADLSGAHGVALLLLDRPALELDVAPLTGRGFVVASVDAPHPGVDVVIAQAEQDTLRARCEANPIASAVATQQLRLAEQLPAHPALISESLAYATLQAGPEHDAWKQANSQRRRVRPANNTPSVLTVDHGPTIEIVLNRPRLKNPLTTDMRNELVAVLAALRHRADVEQVVLAGAGSTFCIGGDLAEFGTVDNPAHAHTIRMASSVARELIDCPVPIEVQVHGACIGAGVELAAFGQRVVADPGATFALPEVAMGVIPGAGGTVSLTERVGRQATARLLLLETTIDADHAQRIGLVDEIAERAA